ncbi:MAG: aldehyde dehydrogenase family protein [Fimbriimonadaceae bacterium]
MSNVTEILESMDYGPAPETAILADEWLDAHDRKFDVFIDGRWRSCKEGFQSFNPATGEAIATISQGDQATINEAVEAAARALGPWQALGGVGRAKLLYAIARQIQKHARLFAVLETIDNGKPIRESRDIDVPLAARHFYYHAGWATLAEREFVGYEAVGVCGQIIPWNFPVLMLAWKIAPALAMGNTVVLKPAEYTPLTALYFAELCERIGLPAGVVNIVTGDGEAGKLLVEHARVDKIAFTGSTEVGRSIRQSTAGSPKKLSLELGGKSPFIVFENADLDATVEGLVDAIWFNQGQVCCAGSRLLAQESVVDVLHQKIRTRMSKLTIGDPLDKGVDVGAIVDAVQLKRIQDLVAAGEKEGATLFQPRCKLPSRGWFYPPTLLTNVEPSMSVAQEEIFGPVLVSMSFRTPEEAVSLANNTVYGLAASVWSQDVDVALDTAAKVKAGTVWVNCTNQFDASSGFGGFRESGFGREGGTEGLFEYLKPRKVKSTGRQSAPASGAEPRHANLDRTHKLFIGGKQVRPDSGYSLGLNVSNGYEDVGRGNRKDIRNAVESAELASAAWSAASAYGRSQVLYYFAENLEASRGQLVESLRAVGVKAAHATAEFEASIARILFYAAWADKVEGAVHQTPMRALVYTRNEPLGTTGVVCPDEPSLLGLLSCCLPLIALGNAVVTIPSRYNPLPAVELYRVIEASDFPAGVWNIVTGLTEELTPTLAAHDGLAAMWHFGDQEEFKAVQAASTGNLKQTWCVSGADIDWFAEPTREFLRRATQVKNVWVPYGA